MNTQTITTRNTMLCITSCETCTIEYMYNKNGYCEHVRGNNPTRMKNVCSRPPMGLQ